MEDVLRSILVGLDSSESGHNALAQALALAALSGGIVHGVCVEERLPAYAETVGEAEEERQFHERHCQQVIWEAQDLARLRGMSIEAEVAVGHASQVLVEKARGFGSDLIVVGRSAHSRAHNAVFGVTADRVVEQALCAVLVVP